MGHFTPIQVAALQTHNGHFCAAQVGGNGDVVLIAMVDGLDHLGIIPAVCVVGIGKQQYQIDLIVSNAGIDLRDPVHLIPEKFNPDGPAGPIGGVDFQG